MSVSGADQPPMDEPVLMGVGGLVQAPVTQMTQVTQVDAGEAGDAEDSDAPAAHRTKRSGKTNSKQRKLRARARQQMMADTDSEGGL